MVGYEAIENAVIARLMEQFPELSTERCRGGGLDEVLDAMWSEDATYGCLVDFGGGRDMGVAKPFSTDGWIWTILGVMMIRYSPTIEQDMRATTLKLATLLSGNASHLGGLVPFAKVVRMSEPDPVQVNDQPFYWLYFEIEATDR